MKGSASSSVTWLNPRASLACGVDMQGADFCFALRLAGKEAL